MRTAHAHSHKLRPFSEFWWTLTLDWEIREGHSEIWFSPSVFSCSKLLGYNEALKNLFSPMWPSVDSFLSALPKLLSFIYCPKMAWVLIQFQAWWNETRNVTTTVQAFSESYNSLVSIYLKIFWKLRTIWMRERVFYQHLFPCISP